MRTFKDTSGATWVASVRERSGEDYKGRFWLVMSPEDGTYHDTVELLDVRWNSRKTAERTLRTMAEKELLRRHLWAVGRKL